MSLHKLTAGSGYDYLTRQVAALDATEKGHTGLASYYTERGESPGVWIGSGMDGIDGLAAGDPVTAEQMRALFGCGLHPLAELRLQQLEGPDLTGQDFQDVTRLGAPFKIVDDADARSGSRWPSASRRSTPRSDGRPTPRSRRLTGRGCGLRWPGSSSSLSMAGSRSMRGSWPGRSRKTRGHGRRRSPVIDLTFSPVKSVSTLWAVADPAVAAVIERAHQAAVKDALAFIEKHALFTRTGPQGIRQVNVRGLVAAAFTHRDSRAGDPDLHTHVAVANKVQTLDGRWLSIDGRVLFKAKVAASETYNTALEQHLRDTLGVRFAERPGTDPAQAADPGDRRCRPAIEPALVDPPRPHQHPPRRARHPIPARSWSTTDPGRSVAPGPAGNVGDPRRQARTPITRRAAHHLAERSRSGARWTRRRRLDGATALTPAAETATHGRRPLGRTDRRPGAGRDGGDPVDLADVACPRRSTTPHPHRRRARRAGECPGRPAGR